MTKNGEIYNKMFKSISIKLKNEDETDKDQICAFMCGRKGG